MIVAKFSVQRFPCNVGRHEMDKDLDNYSKRIEIICENAQTYEIMRTVKN